MKLNWSHIRTGLLFTGTTAGIVIGSSCWALEKVCVKTSLETIKKDDSIFLTGNSAAAGTDPCSNTGISHQLSLHFVPNGRAAFVWGTGSMNFADNVVATAFNSGGYTSMVATHS